MIGMILLGLVVLLSATFLTALLVVCVFKGDTLDPVWGLVLFGIIIVLLIGCFAPVKTETKEYKSYVLSPNDNPANEYDRYFLQVTDEKYAISTGTFLMLNKDIKSKSLRVVNRRSAWNALIGCTFTTFDKKPEGPKVMAK